MVHFKDIFGILDVFSAAGENFSKNDQDQWKMTEKNICMGLFDIILVKYSS